MKGKSFDVVDALFSLFPPNLRYLVSGKNWLYKLHNKQD